MARVKQARGLHYSSFNHLHLAIFGSPLIIAYYVIRLAMLNRLLSNYRVAASINYASIIKYRQEGI